MLFNPPLELANAIARANKPRISPTPWHLAAPLMPIEPVPGMEWECRVRGRAGIGYGASPREAYERWAAMRDAARHARMELPNTDATGAYVIGGNYPPSFWQRLRARWARMQAPVPLP